MIAKKIECLKGIASYISDEEFLLIFEGKITAMAPDLWEMKEFDWDDPENQKMIQEEEKEYRKKWIEKAGFTEEEYKKRLEHARENLKKDQIHK